MSDAIDHVRDGFGTANIGKFGYQASRAAQGLSTTTKLTAALDIAGGATSIGAAHGLTDAAKGLNAATKGAAGAANMSTVGEIAGFASKAAPIVAKGSAVLGGALGAIDVGRGIKDMHDGKTEEGKDKIIGGSCDIVTAGALGVAATSSATVVGVPVAAVALGVAAVAQGVKYRDKIADGVKFAGDKVADGARFAGDKVSEGFSAIKNGLGKVFSQ